MAFVDELKLKISAGHGGDGVVRFRHEKGREFMGPSGGDGGRGADVYIRGVKNLNLLEQYRYLKEIKAENGAPGGSNSMHGKAGDPHYLDLPVGSVITNTDTGEEFELIEAGQEALILRGGDGGFGNEHFKSSTNQAPERALPGRVGEEAVFDIELKLIADVGFVGFPNAGKSTLLNALTNASAKTANYAFTTLIPNLGAYYEFVLADIPGLIEGAGEGKGLGHKFLRHISRTKMILHCIDSTTADVVEAYNTIRKELENFDSKMKDKDEIILLTKTDEVDDEEIIEDQKRLLEEATGKTVWLMSVLDEVQMKEFTNNLVAYLRGE